MDVSFFLGFYECLEVGERTDGEVGAMRVVEVVVGGKLFAQ